MKNLPRFLSALCLTAAALSSARAAETFDAYAPPNFWGKRHDLPGHLGKVTYRLSYRTLGKTLVIGEVEYIKEDGKKETKEFRDEITFTTADVVAQPKVRFKGVPLGSAVVVTVKP